MPSSKRQERVIQEEIAEKNEDESWVVMDVTQMSGAILDVV